MNLIIQMAGKRSGEREEGGSKRASLRRGEERRLFSYSYCEKGQSGDEEGQKLYVFSLWTGRVGAAGGGRRTLDGMTSVNRVMCWPVGHTQTRSLISSPIGFLLLMSPPYITLAVH